MWANQCNFEAGAYLGGPWGMCPQGSPKGHQKKGKERERERGSKINDSLCALGAQPPRFALPNPKLC